MGEVLTFDEIKTRYAPDWVLMGDIETHENLNIVSGRVLFHGPDHDEVYNKLGDFPPGRYAVHCFRDWPEDMELALWPF